MFPQNSDRWSCFGGKLACRKRQTLWLKWINRWKNTSRATSLHNWNPLPNLIFSVDCCIKDHWIDWFHIYCQIHKSWWIPLKCLSFFLHIKLNKRQPLYVCTLFCINAIYLYFLALGIYSPHSHSGHFPTLRLGGSDVRLLCSRLHVVYSWRIWQILIISPRPDWSATQKAMDSDNLERHCG